MSSDEDVVLVKTVPAPMLSPEEQLTRCKVCMSRKVELILLPCRHAVVCEDCFDKLDLPKMCPVCRTYVFQHLHFILVPSDPSKRHNTHHESP